MYDIFYVSSNTVSEIDWAKIKKKYPYAQKIDHVSNFDQIKAKAFTKMFWVIWDDVDIVDTFDLLDYRPTRWDDQYVHVFKNGDNYNGICLFPKSIKISNREFHHRFFIEKKEIDTVASIPKRYPNDIIFISYNESNADKNYDRLLKRFNYVKRVHGVKGIHQAHQQAASIAETEMFWVVDGDAIIQDDFNFDHEVLVYERDTVHVWRSQNPINHLVYGYGGVKLLPRQLTLDMNTNTTDMTTAISKKFKSMPQISNITAFNTDPFNTWKSAFRECVKLSSKIINRQKDVETLERLNVWCTTGKDMPFGQFAISGAIAGKEYGLLNKDNPTEIKKINDFQWLKEYYEQRTKNIHT
jgi:hypothetical protein